MSRSSRQFRVPIWLLVAVISLAWFWFWRANIWTGGDSEQWEREIGLGYWLRKRQMLSFAFMQTSYKIGFNLFGWTPHVAINFISCLAGAVAMAVVWQYFEGMRHRGWLFATVATAGFTTLFCGHIETYPQAIAALLFHLLALRRVVQGRWPLWALPASFALVMLFHLAVLFAAPAALLALMTELRLRNPTRSEYIKLAAAILPIPALLILVTFLNVGRGEFVGRHFILPLPELLARPWAIFTHWQIPIKAQTAWWNAGATAVIVWAAAIWILRRRRHDREALWLIGYFICFVGFVLVWRPDMLERDWDLFSFPWAVAALLLAREIPRLPLRAWALGAVLGVNLLLFATRPATFAEISNRGYGTVYVSFSGPFPHLALFDRRELAHEVSPFRLTGPVVLEVHRPPVVLDSAVINIKDGGQYFFIWNGKKLVLEEMIEPDL